MTTKMNAAQKQASLKALDALLADAVESANTMRDRVQVALVGCVSHCVLTNSNAGVSDRINKFLTELGQGLNLKAVKAWCEKHLHMQETADGKSLCFKPIKGKLADTMSK